MKEADSLGSRFQRKLSHKIPGLRRTHVFEAELNLSDLTAVPFVTGNFFCVIHVNEGTYFRGQTEGSEVRRHTINWNQKYSFTCKLYSRIQDAVLDPCPCRISIIQEATGSCPQKRLGHVIVDLAENAGCGDAKQGLLIQQEKKNHRVGNSIFNLTASLKLRRGDVIFRTPNADRKCAEANTNRRSSHRDSHELDNFQSFHRVEMRPDMKPQGLVHASDDDETRAENAMQALQIRRNSLNSISGRAGNERVVNEREKAMRRFNHQMELLKHQQYIEELLVNESQNEDEDTLDLQRRPSWKDIYCKRVQRHYRFPEKTKMIIGTRVSNFDAVRDVFEHVGINMDFSELIKRSKSKTLTTTALTASTATTGMNGDPDRSQSRLAKVAQLAKMSSKGNLKKESDEKTVSGEQSTMTVGSLKQEKKGSTVTLKSSKMENQSTTYIADPSTTYIADPSKCKSSKQEVASNEQSRQSTPAVVGSSKEEMKGTTTTLSGSSKWETMPLADSTQQAAKSSSPKEKETGKLDKLKHEDMSKEIKKSKSQELVTSKSTSMRSHGSAQSLASIWASESGLNAKKAKSKPSLISSKTSSASGGNSRNPSIKRSRQQDVEFEKLMLRRKELEERNEQRAENFMQRLRAMIKKGNEKKKKKRGLFRRKKEEESFSGIQLVDIFEESESEFSWTKRKLPVLQSRPHIMNDIVELTEQRVRDQGSIMSKDSTSTTVTTQSMLTQSSLNQSTLAQSMLTQSTLDIGSRIDLNAAKEYYSSLKQKDEPNHEGHRKNETIFSSAEGEEVNKYAFRDFQFRIAEEEAIKSDEDVSIRGRRQARKNKLVLNMIKEADAYLLRETVDNNRQKAKLRNREDKRAVGNRASGNVDKPETWKQDSEEKTIENLPGVKE